MYSFSLTYLAVSLLWVEETGHHRPTLPRKADVNFTSDELHVRPHEEHALLRIPTTMEGKELGKFRPRVGLNLKLKDKPLKSSPPPPYIILSLTNKYACLYRTNFELFKRNLCLKPMKNGSVFDPK